MANPTSAFFNAGPSLVPSPVTATTSRLALILLAMMPLTKVYLSTGWDRAKTRSLGQIWSSFCCDTLMKKSNILLIYFFKKQIHTSFVCEGAFYLENYYVRDFTILNIVKMLQSNNLIELLHGTVGHFEPKTTFNLKNFSSYTKITTQILFFCTF